MTIHHIDALVRQANPVPDPTVLDSVELSGSLLEHRSQDMDTHVKPDTVQGPRWPRRLLVGAAAAVIVVVALVGTLAVTQVSDEQPVGEPEQPAVNTENQRRPLNLLWSIPENAEATWQGPGGQSLPTCLTENSSSSQPIGQ